MADIIGWGFGLLVIGAVVWATVAVSRRKPARRKPGGLQFMAAMMLGLGAPMDPPQRHVAEAKDGPKKGSPETGEPELD